MGTRILVIEDHPDNMELVRYVLEAFGYTVNTTLDGESALGTNVVMEYLTNGQWRFPIFAHERYFPGVQVYMMHPPLHYFLVALWVKSFGLGTWQLLAQSTATGIAGAAIVARSFCR